VRPARRSNLPAAVTVTPEIHPYWGFPRLSDGRYVTGPDAALGLLFWDEDELDGNAEVDHAHSRPGAYERATPDARHGR